MPKIESYAQGTPSYVELITPDQAGAKATELGAQVIAPAFDVEGVGRMAVLADPQGGMFNLMAS
jgi:predicted enzyme related to lactoylglutathione lyase